MIKPAKTDKYELHITSDGKTTNAVYKKNGKVVARSQARKHPDGTFVGWEVTLLKPYTQIKPDDKVDDIIVKVK